jgi:hypothetical protein
MIYRDRHIDKAIRDGRLQILDVPEHVWFILAGWDIARL